MPGNSGYATFDYGEAYYGAGSLPASPTFDLFDFCYPSHLVMMSIMAYSDCSSARAFVPPWYTFNLNSDLCMFSDDSNDSGITIQTSIPSSFSFQFTILPTAIPDDFSDLANERLFFAAYNQLGWMAGLLLSENGGLALAQDGLGTGFRQLIDSADLFNEGLVYYTFRVTVNGVTGKTNIYVTPTNQIPIIGHQLRVTTAALATPDGQQDGVYVEVYGSVANPTEIALDCIALSSKEAIPNARPIANPGADQTSTLYKYASFDGRDSYDPEGAPLRHWWTITQAPEKSAMWVTGFGDTPADPSGYTNVINATPGDFDNVNIGDLLYVESQKSVIKYISDDGSYAVAIDHVFVAGTTSIPWSALKQSAWEGNWNPTEMVVVIERTNTEPVGPTLDATYLIGDNPIGNPNWTLGDAGKIAVWNGLTWVITAQSLGTNVFSINDVLNYRLVATGPYTWIEDDPEPWELSHWSGRVFEIGSLLPDVGGLYTIDLMVNDGTGMILPPYTAGVDGGLNSLPVEALLNVSPTGAPVGITPDLSFIWNYLSNFWTLVAGREMFSTIWSAVAQILAGDMLELWQHDYAKGLFDIQRLFQRRWLSYSFVYEEPDYDEDGSEATIDTSVNLAGFSPTPGLNEYSYDLGSPVPAAIQPGHLLILNGQGYEVSRTSGNLIITRDPLPQTTNARVYFESATGSFSIGETVTGSVSLSSGIVLEKGWNYLVLYLPTGAFTVGETLTGSSSGTTADVIGYTPAYNQRPYFWQVRPQVTSVSTDFTLQTTYMADTAVFDIEDQLENTHIRVGCFVYAARGYKLAFDSAPLATYLADPTRYTTRFFGLRRCNFIPVDSRVLDLSSLQEVVNVDGIEGAPSILLGNNDFIVETTTAVDGREIQAINLLESYLRRVAYGFDGDTSTTPSGLYFDCPSVDFESLIGPAGSVITDYVLEVNGARYRLASVVSATRLELEEEALLTGETSLHWRIYQITDPPDVSWAETTYLDNRETIEANFGSRVGFSLEDLRNRTDNLDYLSAVQGLWYAFWNGPTVSNIQTACQVLLGLPFAEAAGTITDIRTPFSTSHNRVLVQDDGDEIIVRSYLFPVDLDVMTNPETGVPYVLGDHIDQFAPICTGVLVEDYISNPTWMENVVGSGDLHEAQKMHTFGVTIDSAAYNYNNLIFMISYILRLSAQTTQKVKPHYTYPMFIVLRLLDDVVDVEDAILFGPAFPPEKVLLPGTFYTYPDNPVWKAGLESPVPAGWVDSPACPPAQNWETAPPYDHTTRWPANRFVNVPPRQVDYGGLHLEDVTGRVPDPWSELWPQIPTPLAGGSHDTAPAEGTFRYGDTDEAGHFIHVYGTVETNLILDADMEDGFDPGNPSSPWQLANYGGSSHPLTAVKSGAQFRSPANSTYISSIGPSLGIEQAVVGVDGRQEAVRLWIYLVSGQAHIQLYDGTSLAAEKRLSAINTPLNTWTEVTLHNWEAQGTGHSVRILTGPSGGTFYVDDVGLYSDAVPWSGWGYGRMYTGRTGGYTVGGSPDEEVEFTVYTEIT